MDYNPMVPIWLQVATMIKSDLVTDRIKPGDKLPGGRELAQQYTINPNTAARVYQELEKEGLCETRRGLGTFATSSAEKIQAVRKQMAEAAADRFLQELERIGLPLEEGMKLLQSIGGKSNA